jgi:hypothetical protein
LKSRVLTVQIFFSVSRPISKIFPTGVVRIPRRPRKSKVKHFHGKEDQSFVVDDMCIKAWTHWRVLSRDPRDFDTF